MAYPRTIFRTEVLLPVVVYSRGLNFALAYAIELLWQHPCNGGNIEQEAITVALRRHRLLPLAECLRAL